VSTHVAVTQSVLAWALQRADRSYEETVKKFPKFGDWMSGDALPSLRELEKFASFTHVSLGVLIMPEPPDETLPIADMRTRDSKVIERPSGNLLDTIDRYQQFQDWYHDYAREQGAEKLPFLGSVSSQDKPHMVAHRVRELLLLDQITATTPEQWRRDIVKALEEVGVLVMMSGIVGTNTHRPLSTDEFRGFSLYDDLAPLIFVNLAGESYGAQNFTLVHEFTHLLAGHSALSGGDHLLGCGGVMVPPGGAAARPRPTMPWQRSMRREPSRPTVRLRVALVFPPRLRSTGCTALAGSTRNATTSFWMRYVLTMVVRRAVAVVVTFTTPSPHVLGDRSRPRSSPPPWRGVRDSPRASV